MGWEHGFANGLRQINTDKTGVGGLSARVVVDYFGARQNCISFHRRGGEMEAREWRAAEPAR